MYFKGDVNVFKGRPTFCFSSMSMSFTSLPMCGFIAQLVEHRTGIAEVTGSNPVEALIFFRLLLSNCLNWKIHCDDHISLSSYVFKINYDDYMIQNNLLKLQKLLPS